jgi:hypothetical protein
MGGSLLSLPPVLAIGALSLTVYGWGRAVHVPVYGWNSKVAHAYSAGLGTVALIFIGGVLDVFGLARSAALATVTLAGIVLSLFFIVSSLRNSDIRSIFSRANAPVLVFLAATAGLTIFLSVNLLPTQVFNYDDDFRTYLVRVLRMRETGIASNSPFEVIGLSGFGADTFFQSLTMTWLPLTGVTAFDTIFCFVLGILLLAEMGRTNNASWPLIVLAVLVYIFINPMIVNISSVYSTAALLLTLTSATSALLSASDINTTARVRYAFPVGASLAALVALKTTNIPFAISYLAVLFGGLLLQGANAVAAMSILAILGSGAVAFLPWFLTQFDKMLVLLRTRSVALPVDSALTIPWSFAEAFRSEPTTYGSTRADYIFALIAVQLMVIAAALRLWRRIGDGQALLWLATGIGCLATYLGLAGFHNNTASLRYAAPFVLTIAALGAYPAVASAVWGVAKQARLGLMLGIVTAQFACISFFAKSTYDRGLRIVTQHTPICYPTTEGHRHWQAFALSEQGRAVLRNAQAQTNVGTTIFAWVDLPFQFDFGRNRILQLNNSFFLAPWRFDTSSFESVREEFKRRRIDYILIEYRGMLTIPQFTERELRSPMWPEDRICYDNSINLIRAIHEFSVRYGVVFNNGGMALIRIGNE